MIRKCLASILSLLLILSVSVFAQDDDLRSVVDYKVNKMKKELDLTDGQAAAVKPIIKDYLVRRDTMLQGTAGQGIIDHVSVQETLKKLKDNEYQKLSKILSPDQMKQWINKQNVMAALNPDGAESTVDDDGAGLTGTGVDLKF